MRRPVATALIAITWLVLAAPPAQAQQEGAPEDTGTAPADDPLEQPSGATEAAGTEVGEPEVGEAEVGEAEIVEAQPVEREPVAPPPPPRGVAERHAPVRPTTVTRSATQTTSRSSPATSQAPARERRPVPEHEEDDGRSADFLWLEFEGGVSYVDLIALENQSFAGGGTTVTTPGFRETQGTGPMVGVAGGFRLSVFALGVRGTFASYGDFDIGTVGGEVHLRIPTPVIEPYIRVGAGYAWQGNANYQNLGGSTATVYGWTVNGAVGLDVFVLWWLSLGVGVQVDLLNMTRQSDPTAMCMGITDFCPTQEGDALGLQGRAFAQVGLHF